MKTLFSIIFSLMVFGAVSQTLKPYILGSTTGISVDAVREELIPALKKSGFKVLGWYSPAEDINRLSIVVSHPELMAAVRETGGLTGFAGIMRIGVTREGTKTNISYTNPTYWGNAYFGDRFPSVRSKYDNVKTAFVEVMNQVGDFSETAFGCENGIEANDLRRYRYMFGMPRFDDTEVVGEFSSYDAAVKTIDANLQRGVANGQLVYRLEYPGLDLALYGIGFSGDEGEADFLPTIDITSPKHTAFLPYEVLVLGSEVHMLHGRYRIALSFPDLTMGTFTKIMSTPGNIEELMKEVAKK